MRILMLAQFYPPTVGGEERHVRNLSIDLVRRGHDVSVATLGHLGSADAEIDQGVKIYRLRGTLQRDSSLFTETERRHAPPFPDPELLYGLSRIAARTKPDIVHAHNWLLHSFLPIKRRTGAPLVVTLHDFSLVCAKKNSMRAGSICDGPALVKCLGCAKAHYGAVKGGITTVANWISSRYERRRVDKFIAVSRAVADGNGLAKLPTPFEVIPNFVPDDIATLSALPDPRLRQLPSEGYLLFVGDLNRIKGVHVLMKAYSTLRQAPTLVLIGRRCPDAPKEFPPNVLVFDSWPHGAIMQAWKRCLFGLVPSIWADPCPTVVMEAMALGKPVIAADAGGNPDLVDRSETGLLVPPGDATALAAAMRSLVENADLRARLGAKGLLKAQTLKAAAIVPRIERTYEKLIATAAAGCSEGVRNAA
ncbi:MAG: glycosyltransferase family 4 protein [Hyphomicrobiales bacterium]